jgi:hypothetical protein
LMQHPLVQPQLFWQTRFIYPQFFCYHLSFFDSYEQAAHFSPFSLVFTWPNWELSWMSSLPSENRLYHSETLALQTPHKLLLTICNF